MPAQELDLPLTEVSGLAAGSGPEGPRVAAIGDAAGVLAVAVLGVDGTPGPWRVTPLTWGVVTAETSLEQLEAVAWDGSGQVVLSQEEPSRLLVVASATGAVVAEIALDLAADPELAKLWRADPNSRAESLVLLPGGCALLVKEKRPMMAVLLAPADRPAPALTPDTPVPALGGTPWWDAAAAPSGTLRPVATWPMGKRLQRLGDIADAALGPDGALYLLSDQTATIVRVPELPAPGEPLRASHAWEVSGDTYKCEGLAFAPSGAALVGVDTPKAKRNLLLLEPWL